MSSTPRRAAAAALAGLLATSVPGSAQVAWDAPSLMAPGSPAGWGVHLFDPDPGDIGVFATWRSEPAPVGLGFRFGVAEDGRDDLSFLAGVDVSGAIHRGTGDPPLDVIWFAGGGIGFGDDALVSFPAGISLGWSFAGDEVAFRPYVAPKVVLDAFLGDDDVDPDDRPRRFRDDDLDLEAAVEIGMDLAFTPSFAIRAGASLGDRDAVSIGIQLPGG